MDDSLPILNNPPTPAPATLPEPSAGVPRGTYAFVSLGCPKNLVDSERMLGKLASEGYVPVSDPRDADLVVVNTCGFIESARDESLAVIEEMGELKKKGVIKGLMVTGCLSERMGSENLIEQLPIVDQAIGVFDREAVVQAADRVMAGVTTQRTEFRPAEVRPPLEDTARLRVTPRHFGYLKISEGCNRTCTFCAIPKMRGKHVTKPPEAILAEARELIDDGVRELILVSQDTTYYGIDHFGEPRLAQLLQQVDQLDGLDWIRLLYFYPEHVTDQLLDVLANANKIVPYVDIPLQHANDRVLKRMQRRHNRQQTEDVINKLRDRWPGVSIRTTFIVGFPGETDEQFQDLVDFVQEYKFERMGVFTYSPEPATPAMKLDGHLPDDVKFQRQETVMLAQQQVAFEHARQQVGKTLEVLIDGPDDFDDPEAASAAQPAWLGRTTADAPDIDTLVRVTGKAGIGQFVPVTIEDHDGYDLMGTVAGPAR